MLHIFTEWIETTLGDVNKKKLQERSKHTSSSSEPNNVCGGRDDCLPGSDINETGSLNKQNGGKYIPIASMWGHVPTYLHPSVLTHMIIYKRQCMRNEGCL